MNFLKEKLDKLLLENRLRKLPNIKPNSIDFCSNDYLGVVKNNLLKDNLENFSYGSTGSRLISGNTTLTEKTEQNIANFHNAESALIFNSGYDANLGIFSCIAKKGDTIIYDEYIHASIRDGIRLNFAYSFMFKHNDILNLEEKLKIAKGNIFVAIESLYSMDGDYALLENIIFICNKYKANIIIDEAHTIGVIGEKGEGLTQSLNLHKKCFARIYTFGKAMGIHGATIVGSQLLIKYLINNARSFIYTTALPPYSINHINEAYKLIPTLKNERKLLNENVKFFKKQFLNLEILKSNSAIQGILIKDTNKLINTAQSLQNQKYAIIPIRVPTVPEDKERIRICLHSFNTQEEIINLYNEFKRIII